MPTRGRLKRFSTIITVAQKSLDVLLILLLLGLSLHFFDESWLEPRILILAFCAVASFLFFANINGLYKSWRSLGLWSEVYLILYSLCGMGLCLLLLAYATKVSSDYSRLALGTWILLIPLVLSLQRLILRKYIHYMRARGHNSRRVAILGSGELAQQLAQEVLTHSWMGIEIRGFYDEANSEHSNVNESSELKVIGDFHDLINKAKANEYDDIYIALPMSAEKKIAYLINELRDSSVPVHLVPDLFIFNLINSKTSNIGKLPIVSVYESPLDEMGVLVKNVEDIILSILILLLAAIPMLIISLIIKLTSSGKVIFKQRRYGLGGDEIVVYKFRTMTVSEDGENIGQARKQDFRVTRFGRFLRRTSLDELPQFFNVLQGRMSIVGPRPHAVAHNELYRKTIDGYMLRYLVKPGITGWAQINGWRGETEDDEKMKMRIKFDIEYLETWSLRLDLKIILLTISRGFTGKNVY